MPSVVEPIALATLMLQGLISPERVADHLRLQVPMRNHFLSAASEAINDAVLNPVRLPDRIDQLAKQLDALMETAPAAAAGMPRSPRMLDTGPLDLGALVTPYVLRASALMDKHSFEAPEVNTRNALRGAAFLAEHGEALLGSVLSGAGQAANAFTGGGLGAGLGIIRELQFQHKEQEKTEKLHAVIAEAEASYLQWSQSYGDVRKYYQNALQKLQEEYPDDRLLYQQKVEEWLKVERIFVDEIIRQQQKIAVASAMVQEMQSKRRLDRVGHGLDMLLAMTVFAGPPGAIASSVVKAVATVGFELAAGMVEKSARLNHGVTSAADLLFITDAHSLEVALAQLSTAHQPVVAITGSYLTPTLLLDTDVRDPEAVAKRLVRDMEDRCACFFSLLRALPEIPVVEMSEPGQDFSNNTLLKKAGKERLEALIATQIKLNEQMQYLHTLASTLMRKRQPWPYVLNLAELRSAIVDSHKALQIQIERLQVQMGPTYLLKQKTEGARALQRLRTLGEDFQKQARSLQMLEQDLCKTPHAILFADNAPVHFSKCTAEKRREIVEMYQRTLQATLTWFKEVAFQVEALDRLTAACVELGSGHAIKNAEEALEEIDAQLGILNELAVSVVDRQSYTYCYQRMAIVRARVLGLARSTVEYAAKNPLGIETAGSQYAALVHFPVHKPAANAQLLDLALIKTEARSSVAVQLIEAQSALLEGVQRELAQPLPIQLDASEPTQAIVSPHRAFFGLRKHEDMQAAIDEKIKELKQKTPGLVRLQIMPLEAINHSMLAACAEEAGGLKSMMEGLKTEIQWVVKFREACLAQGIQVMNERELHQYYERQINILRLVYQKDTLPKIENHRILRTEFEQELQKAEDACMVFAAGVRKMSPESLQVYREMKAAIHDLSPIMVRPWTDLFPTTDYQVAYHLNEIVEESMQALIAKIGESKWANLASTEKARLFEQVYHLRARQLFDEVIATTPGMDRDQLKAQIAEAFAQLLAVSKAPASYAAHRQKLMEAVMGSTAPQVYCELRLEVERVVMAEMQAHLDSRLNDRDFIRDRGESFKKEVIAPLFESAVRRLMQDPRWRQVGRNQQEELLNKLGKCLAHAIDASGPITANKKEKRRLLVEAFFSKNRSDRYMLAEPMQRVMIKQPVERRDVPAPVAEPMAIEVEEEVLPTAGEKDAPVERIVEASAGKPREMPAVSAKHLSWWDRMKGWLRDLFKRSKPSRDGEIKSRASVVDARANSKGEETPTMRGSAAKILHDLGGKERGALPPAVDPPAPIEDRRPTTTPHTTPKPATPEGRSPPRLHY